MHDYSPIGDRTHERRLSGTVATAKTVAVTTLEAKGRSVEQDLGTVGERELAVAQILTLLLIVSNLVLLITSGRRLDNPLVDDRDGLGRSS